MGYHQVVAEIFARDFSTWVNRLAGRFSRLPQASIEDAISDVFASAFEKPNFERSWREGGRAGLTALLSTAAWRAVNTASKTGTRRRDLLGRQITSTCNPVHPERIALARDEGEQLCALIPEAARRFGGRKPRLLECALHDGLKGWNDSECARRHGVRREAVNRARNWLRRQRFQSADIRPSSR